MIPSPLIAIRRPFSFILVKMNSLHADKFIGKTMLKTCFFILFVMFMRPAVSGSIMSHEKFIHLDYEEQKQIVIATMELVVELEANYQREVKISGFNSERFRRYSEFMRSVSSLMFSEAHAASGRNQRYGQYLNQLTVILNEKERNRCIYGGWISEMVGDKCTHPLKSEKFKKLYQSESNCSSGNNKITCNPAIFGFKNVDPAKMTLFCVDAGPNGADNTSRDCMAKALAEKPEAGASSSEIRIKHMIAEISKNPVDAKGVFNFLFKACACDASKTPQISKLYSDYMRPHQTCYSILKMMSEFGPKCELKDGPLMDSNQTQFLKVIQGILDPDQYKSKDVKVFYTAKLDELRKNPEFKASESAICGGSSPGTIVDDKPTQVEECKDFKTPDNKFCCPKGQVRVGATDTCVADPKNDTAIIVNGTEDPEIVVTATRLPKDGEPVPDQEKPVPDPKPAPDKPNGEGTETVKICDNGATTESECKTCTANEEMNDETKKCEPKTVELCENGATKDSDCDSCPTDQEFNDENKCEEKAPPKITFNLTAEDKDVNITIVTVTLSPEKTSKDGYKLMWFSRGKNRPTTFTGTTKRKEPEPDIAGADPVDSEATPDENAKEDLPPDETGKPKDDETDLNKDDFWGPLDSPRQSNEYEVCARLIKDAKIEHEDCEKIPGKPGIAPLRNGPGQFGPQQFGPTRGGPSDAIFRGIR